MGKNDRKAYGTDGGYVMNQKEMFDNACWIDCEGGDIAPIFIKRFEAEKGEKAEITICGLGFFELEINGRRVGSDLLVPAASNYSRRDMSKWSYPLFDKMSFRTYVMQYDITDYLIDGENRLKVMLGTGYFHQNMRQAEGNVDYGTPKLCYIIRKSSGNVISDSSTLCHKGYFLRNNLYFGEFQDLTAVPKENEFRESREIPAPETDFYYNIAPSDKITETIENIRFMGEYGGSKLYDIGINTVGRAVMKCNVPGCRFTVDYAEEIGGAENFGIHFSRDRFKDDFISDGITAEYSSKFSWQGFRYLKVTGDAEPVRVEVIHSDCPVTSSFECDNENLNWLYNTFVHTQLCNMHSGVPSDCPHRERLGYTGDGQLCCEAAMLTLDSRSFYRKWLYDILDCQCKESGHIQHTAPAMGGGGGPCGWGGAVVEVPYVYYKMYGDTDVLREFYPAMLKFFDYLDSRSDFGLVSREEPGGWCLGDWLPPTPIQVPESLVNSCLYVGFLKKAAEIARIIGKSEDIPGLIEKAEKVSAAVNAAYYSFQQRAYCGDINGASSLALAAGIAGEDVAEKVIAKYKALGQFDTGIIATEALIGFLFSAGESQLAVDLLANDKEVSFSHMRKSGATTLWENWNGQSSRNHPMFGAVTKYLFKEILGIKQPDDSAGYKKIIIAPAFVKSINYAKGHITTEQGVIAVEYRKAGKSVTVNIKSESPAEVTFVCAGYTETFTGEKEITLEIDE